MSIEAMRKELDEIKLELQKIKVMSADMITTLGWYADPENYRERAPNTYITTIDEDGGKLARKTLGI